MECKDELRIEKCPVEQLKSQVYPLSFMREDANYYLGKIRVGKKLSYKEISEAMGILDICELCSDYFFCRKRRRRKVRELTEYVKTHV
jgi:hypothetical protein